MRGCAAQNLPDLPVAPGRAGGWFEPGRLERGTAESFDVCLGANSRAVRGDGFARVCKAADERGAGGSFTRDRFWTDGRRICPVQPDRKQSPHAPSTKSIGLFLQRESVLVGSTSLHV